MVCLNDSVKINNFPKAKSELIDTFEKTLNIKSQFEK